VKKETYPRITDDLEDSTGASGDDDDQGSYEPKRSPMRRKEKFRSTDFREEKKQKDRRRNLRGNKYDFKF
jgi:hypothetical protein